MCTNCSSCAPGEYVVHNCHGNYDTACAPCKTCNHYEYRATLCTADADTVCNACSACNLNEYLTAPCTATTDTICAACAACNVGTYQTSPCGTGGSGSCSPCTTCTTGTYAAVPCESSHDAICVNCSTCKLTEYAASPCTPQADVDCRTCSVCPASTYLKQPCTATADTQCSPCSVCPPGSYATAQCTADADTVCAYGSLDNEKNVIISVGTQEATAMNMLGLASSKTTTYLSMLASTITDMFGNAVNSVSGQLVANYTARTLTYSTIRKFVMDMSQGIIHLSMNQAMNVSLVNGALITLTNSETSNATSSITLYNVTLLPSNLSWINLKLSETTLISIKALGNLCVSAVTCDIHMQLGALRDIFGVPSNLTSAQANIYIPDLTVPLLTSFGWSFATGSLLLTFSKPVGGNSFNFSGFTFSNSRFLNDSFIILSNIGSYSLGTSLNLSSDRLSGSVALDSTDINWLKYKRICIRSSNCFLSLDEGAFFDTLGNKNPATNYGSALAVNPYAFIADTISPSLITFSLFDGNSGIISLSFNEPIDLASIDFYQLVLANSLPLLATVSMNLSGGIIHTSNLDTILNITFLSSDFNLLKLDGICKVSLQCGLELTTTFVNDVSGNAINPVGLTFPLNPTNNNQLPRVFIPDTRNPKLVSFSLNMNSLILSLSYDEPVTLSPVSISGYVIIQNANPATINLTLSDPATLGLSLNPSPVINIQIGGLDVIHLKATIGLGKNANNTFLTVRSNLVKDLAASQNPSLLQVAISTTNYYPDTIPPTLSSFLLFDAVQGLLGLSFNEPVYNNSVVFTHLTITSKSTGGTNYSSIYNYAENYYADSTDKRVLYIYLPSADLQHLRLIPGLAVSASTTFVYLSLGFIRDMAGNANSPNNPATGVVQYISTSNPVLTAYTLNMNNGELSLTFSSVVDATTVNPGQLSFQSDMTGTSSVGSYTLSSSYVNSTSGFIILIQISTVDLNAIKGRRGLAKNINNTYVFITADFGKDTSIPARPILAIGTTGALQAAVYIPDTIPPFITIFQFTLGPCHIFLNFSETVDLTTLNVSGLAVQNSSHYSVGGYPAPVLVVANSISPTDVGLWVNINVASVTSNVIKSVSGMGESIYSTYLTAGLGTILDMAGNPLVSISSTSALQAYHVVGNLVPPTIIAFSLNMNTSVLSLTFSEYINIDSYIPAGLTLHNSAIASSALNVTLSFPLSLHMTSMTSLDIRLNPTDSNNIKLKAKQGFAVNTSTTFLSAAQNTFEDTSGNPLFPLYALPTSAYTPDTNPPSLLSFNFDMLHKTFTVHFSEAMDVTSMRPSYFEFQNSRTRSNSSIVYRLTNSIVASSSNGISFQVNLSATDTVQMQLLYPLCGTARTCWMVMLPNAVANMYGTFANPVSPTFAANVSNYIYDTKGPQLVSFAADMGLDQLTLNFNKPVNASTLNPTALTLQNAFSSTSPGPLSFQSYTLTGGNNSLINGLQVVLTLSSSDVSILRATVGLFAGINTSYLVTTSALVNDLSELSVQPISSAAALLASTFIRDLHQGSIIGMDVDFANLFVVLHFDKVIQASSLNFSGLTFQVSANTLTPSGRYTLTGGILQTAFYNSSIAFVFTKVDADAMKLARICITASSCWLTSTNSAALDEYGEGTLPRLNNVNALPTTIYLPDNVPPALLSFDLNMNTGQLILNFSEPILASSVQVNGFSLQNLGSMAYTSKYTLTPTHSQAIPIDSTVITIVIGSFDLNGIKAFGNLALSSSTSYLTFTNNTLTDISGNSLQPAFGINVLQYTPDITPPTILAFSVDYNAAVIITLTFSEVVNSSSFIPSFFILLGNNASGGSNLTLTGGNFSTSVDIYTSSIQLELSKVDENTLKALYPIWSSLSHTYLAVISGAVHDDFKNALAPIPVSSPLPASQFLVTNVHPDLISFTLDLNASTLILTFTETVNASSFDISGLSLLNSRWNATIAMPLSVGYPLSLAPSSILVISMTRSEMNKIESYLPNLAKFITSTFLAVASHTIRDMFGNFVIAHNETNAVGAGLIIPDRTPIELFSFSLDMTLGILSLNFSKTMNYSALNVSGLVLQNTNLAQAAPLVPFRLNPASSAPLSIDYPVLSIILGETDLNGLKLAQVGLTRDVTLNVDANAAVDMSGNALNAIDGVAISSYYPDKVPPVLQAFDLNMSSGLLTFSFSEVMRASTIQIQDITLQGKSISLPQDGTIEPKLYNSALLGGSHANNSNVLVVVINNTDLNAIKANELACKSANNTFLIITSAFGQDMSGNNITAIFPGLQVQNYTKDFIKPIFISFDLDMTTGKITLTFDETMLVSSLHRDYFKLLGAALYDGVNYFQLDP